MKVAAVQLNSTADTAANMATADRLTRAAAADGARLIVLPEKWTALGRDEDLRAGAQTLDGPAITWARELAHELRIELIAGSIVERRAGSPLLANTSVHIDAHGELRAVYRKLHMFDVEVEGRAYRESAVTEPGSEIVSSASADGLELGLAICYDLRFPELFAALARRGARVIVLPSAFTLPTTRDHWEILVRARAIENEVFVIAANQVGEHPGGHHSGGRSLIVDPWGVVLARAEESEGWIAAELDLDRQREIRAQLPVLAHRRGDVYGRVETTASRSAGAIA
ncbi:MAG TPA: carbon-nitrogen hydrolase family protein [Solirubrobacteraceae bacterium]